MSSALRVAVLIDEVVEDALADLPEHLLDQLNAGLVEGGSPRRMTRLYPVLAHLLVDEIRLAIYDTTPGETPDDA